MDVTDNAVNRRAVEGNLPLNQLIPFYDVEDCQIDVEKESEEALKIMRETPDAIHFLLSASRDRINELDNLNRSDIYQGSPVNCFINVRCRENDLTPSTYLDASNLIPVISQIDKMIWYWAEMYYINNTIIRENDIKTISNNNSMMFAWIYLLLMVQEKELKHGKTISFNAVPTTESIINIIMGDWSIESQKYFFDLKSTEVGKLEKLYSKRNDLTKRIIHEAEAGKTIAEETDNEWNLAIEFLNDLSKKESLIIDKILEDTSAKDKLQAINDYDSVLWNIEKGHYDLGDRKIQLEEMFDSVDERMLKTPHYSKVFEEGGTPFVLSPSVFALAKNPKTYNFLFITFHQFRMSPNKDTAKRFVSLALDCIKKNFNMPRKEWISINDMISDFHSTVIAFFENNKDSIERLSFGGLQRDAIVSDEASYSGMMEVDAVEELLTNHMNDFLSNGDFDRSIERTMFGQRQVSSSEEVTEQIKALEDNIEKAKEGVFARRIVISLNIIYLFCEALRIIHTNKRIHVKVDKKAIERYRWELMRLDEYLVHKVYSHLGYKEMGMLEYRERSGIISNTLSEKENQEEALRNEIFSTTFKDIIIQLTDSIEKEDAEGIIAIKTRIKEEILRYPGCDEKEQYAEWIDKISEKLCNALINNCKQEHDDYDAIKKEILGSLGGKSNMLPVSTVDSLTTAEMLYRRYATDEFAEKGFDFSCISALYYQAFEDGYNGLIWKGYADRLNNLVIKGKSYTDIIKKDGRKKELTDPDFFGYLHKVSNQRNRYIQFPSKEKKITTTSVSHRCMYTSFAILMESVKSTGELDKYCDYFAEITGYNNKNEMFCDVDFMNLCERFTKAVKNSADNRNNASHGGTFISKKQCSEDKKTVLNDLETVRSSSIGLIQQLLYILYKE